MKYAKCILNFPISWVLLKRALTAPNALLILSISDSFMENEEGVQSGYGGHGSFRYDPIILQYILITCRRQRKIYGR